jgi:hypothetical protein
MNFLGNAFPKHRFEMFYLKTKNGARSQGWHADQREYYVAWDSKEKLEFDRNDVPLSAFLSIEMEFTLGIASEWIPGTDICQNNTVLGYTIGSLVIISGGTVHTGMPFTSESGLKNHVRVFLKKEIHKPLNIIILIA